MSNAEEIGDIINCNINNISNQSINSKYGILEGTTFNHIKNIFKDVAPLELNIPYEMSVQYLNIIAQQMIMLQL